MNYIKAFETLTAEELSDFVTNHQDENLHLDFKTLRDAAFKSDDDKRSFVRALSGFANSSGGLLVWGIDARKNAKGIDCATELKPIDQVAQLIGRLNSLTGEAVDPTIPGVLHRMIEVERGRGFALTLVPESEVGPHMAKLGEDRYYKRSGDSFYKMEHYDIADMFGRRRRPKLTVFYRITSRGEKPEVHLGLRNDGRASAKTPFFAFDCEGPLQRNPYGLDGNRHDGLTRLPVTNSGLRWTYGGGMDPAIHPAMAHEVACLKMDTLSDPPPTEDVVIHYAVACEDQPLERGSFVIPIGELR